MWRRKVARTPVLCTRARCTVSVVWNASISNCPSCVQRGMHAHVGVEHACTCVHQDLRGQTVPNGTQEVLVQGLDNARIRL